MGLIAPVKGYLDAEADKLSQDWFNKFRISIKSLSDERQDTYNQIKSWSAEPQDINLAAPSSLMQATTIRDAAGVESPLPTYENHLLCDDLGRFPMDANTWEVEVVRKEMQREGFIAWYRNPSRSSQDSLGVSYLDRGEYKLVRPDFIFFVRLPDGSVTADIVDPHGTQFGDALPKIQGLAKYAEAHDVTILKDESAAKVGEKLRVLDLTDPAVRDAVAAATEPNSLYEGHLAVDY